MKVLFLDIDGVLITEASARYFKWKHRTDPESDTGWRTTCPIATNNLRILMARVRDMKIVLSSSWRTGRTAAQCSELLTEHGLDGARCIDRTGRAQGERVRGLEIQDWLDAHPDVTHFAIVDDDSDMAHLMTHLVQTNGRTGLTLDDNDAVAKLLGAI